jgi:hypothetical protein
MIASYLRNSSIARVFRIADVMEEQIEGEKVWIQLHETNEEIWQSLEKKLKQAVNQILLIVETISSIELSEQQKDTFAELSFNSNLSRLRNGLVRYLSVTAALIANEKGTLENIAEFRVVIYEKKLSKG